jgi:hypothetical protein
VTVPVARFTTDTEHARGAACVGAGTRAGIRHNSDIAEIIHGNAHRCADTKRERRQSQYPSANDALVTTGETPVRSINVMSCDPDWRRLRSP